MRGFSHLLLRKNTILASTYSCIYGAVAHHLFHIVAGFVEGDGFDIGGGFHRLHLLPPARAAGAGVVGGRGSTGLAAQESSTCFM